MAPTTEGYLGAEPRQTVVKTPRWEAEVRARRPCRASLLGRSAVTPINGRRLLRVEVTLDHGAEPMAIEVPAEEVRVIAA